MSKPLFVAFSDPHVGRVWGSHAVPTTREKLTDRYMDPIREVVATYPDTPIICGGDWFDRAHNSERIIQASIPLIEKMTMVLAGNHDHAGRESAVTSMDLIDGLLDGRGGVVRANDHLNDYELSWDVVNGVSAYCIPHAGTQALFEEACYKASSIASTEDSSKHKVLVIHANVGAIGGGKPDSCLYLTPQLQQGIEHAFDFILTGHEHQPKRLGKLLVMGSTQPCGFGELGERYFWEFHEEDGELTAKKVRINSQLTTVNYDIATLLKTEEWKGAELVDLHGTLPISQARNVQRMVKDFFAGGTLAVRMGVTFDSGTVDTGDQVERSMKNLVEVVRGEISENQAWVDLLEEALSND